MKIYNDPPAVEFEYKNITYRVEPDFDNNQCHWCRTDNPQIFTCDLADPAYPIKTYDEEPDLFGYFAIYIGSDDPHDYGLFLARLNKAVRHFLPENHHVRFEEVSEKFKNSLKLPARE